MFDSLYTNLCPKNTHFIVSRTLDAYSGYACAYPKCAYACVHILVYVYTNLRFPIAFPFQK